MNKMSAIRKQLFLWSIPDPGHRRPAVRKGNTPVENSLPAKRFRSLKNSRYF